MTSKDFFGNHIFKDINVALYNNNGELIYRNVYTTFAHANPKIRNVIFRAMDTYKKDYVYKGEPTEVEIFTTPAYKKLTAKIQGTRISIEKLILF